MLRAIAALALLAVAVPNVAESQRDPCRGVRGRMTNGDGARTRIVVSDARRCLEVLAVGRVTFTDADDDVATLERGGSLHVTESRGGTTRSLSLVERGGRIERAYRVNDAERPAAEGAEWFAAIVLDLVRETGFGAEARVARIRARGGVAAVLDEVGRLRSSHVRRVYLTQLLEGGGLTDADVRRVAIAAGERLSSDHDKATLLRAVVEERGADRGVADAVVAAAATLGSDHDRSNVLRAMLARGAHDDALVARALDAARTMGSDHDRASVLLVALERGAPAGQSAHASFFRAVDAIGSDHDRRRVLTSLAGRETLGVESARAVLASAARLGSDHDKAAVLLAVAARAERLRDAPTRAAFDAALRTIGSDHDYRRVARVLERVNARALVPVLAGVTLAAAAVAPLRAQSPGIVDGPVGARLDSLLSRYERYGFAGTVLVARGGRVVLHRGYGLADRARGTPNDTNTLYEVGSLNKTVTAAAALLLQARGRLHTSDALARWVGPLPPPKDRATVHHLATHTGGLVPDGYALDGAGRDAFLRSVAAAPAESPPGGRYRYTNAGYSVLAAVVEMSSGESYERYVRAHLLAPAGLADASFRGEPSLDSARLARGYTDFGATPAPNAPYVWGTRGAGGLVTRVADVHRWWRALRDTSARALLPAAARATMFHPWPTEGYGWHVESTPGGARVTKGGGMPMYASHLLAEPGDSLVVVWASNSLQQRWRQALNRGLVAAATGAPYVVPPALAAPGSLHRDVRAAGRWVDSSGAALALDTATVRGVVCLRAGTMPLCPAAGVAGRWVGFDPVAVAVVEATVVAAALRVRDPRDPRVGVRTYHRPRPA